MHREKSFVPASFKVCIDELFDNLKLGKEIIVLEKSLEKVSNFGSKYLYEACLILNVAYRHISSICEHSGSYSLTGIFAS